MTVWTEQEADFKIRPLRDGAAKLGFAALCALAARLPHRGVVIVARSLRTSIEEHLECHSVEAGGLLLGRVYDGGTLAGLITYVTGFVPSTIFAGTGVSLVMSAQVWDAAREHLKEGEAVVGWYHSHPGLGAFFSGTDRVTQRNFFSHDFSVGLVSDPLRKDEKWFIGAESLDATPIVLSR